jgi:hypothetical protein
MLDFPVNPAIGDNYQDYTWDGAKWVSRIAPFGATLVSAGNDAAAAALGVVVGGFYRNGSVVMVRVT